MQSRSIEGAIIPSGENLIDRTVPEYEAGDFRFDGRFYQTVDEVEYARRQQVIDAHLQKGNVAAMGIGVYQQWAELDWKQPHGTYAAVQRWSDKLREEAAEETPDALYEYAAERKDNQVKIEATKELGDVLWTICALTSNAGQSTDAALQSYLWGDGKISHREKPLTIGKIDEIVANGLTPWFSPLDELEPPEAISRFILFDEMEPRKNLILRAAGLAITCAQQYTYGASPSDFFSVSSHQLTGKERIAPLAADQIVLIAWYAHNLIESTLSEVVEQNILKIQQRVKANLIDKSDGDRSTLAGN